MLSDMIAIRLAAIRPFRLPLPANLRKLLPTLIWGGGWLGLGVALGALTDAIVRIVA